MNCPHCGQNHPDTYIFCPETGNRIASGAFCINPECNFRQPLPLGTRYCPQCGVAIDNNEMPLRQVNNNETRIIIAYSRADEDEDSFSPDLYKYVTIFKNNSDNVLYSGFVFNHRDYSLNELKITVGQKTVINLEPEYGNYLEVSKEGIRAGLNIDALLRSNFYGQKDCTGFEVVANNDDYSFRSQRTGKQYKDIRGNFLINYDENELWGDVTYYDLFDRFTERQLHFHIPVRNETEIIEEHEECQYWLPFEDDGVVLLVNGYNRFRLDENEIVVKNFMYEPGWQPGYRIWSYSSQNRILTTMRYDEYEPDYEGIEILRMRDENGTIINNINAEGLFLKRNFKYNRCLAIKESAAGRKLLVYIDENGQINEIPNIRVHGEVEEIECFFVTEDVLVLQEEDGAIMLTTNGEVIFDSYSMIELPGNLVEFYDNETGQHGVIDSTGSIIIPAEYDTFDVMV